MVSMTSMQDQQLEHGSQLVSEYRPATSNWSVTSSEPYYSNEEISILHDVVLVAQKQLLQSKHPKPLPAAALFKAYDEVLPKHGIDPDSDHHLSNFIFRVGGERGSGTLLDKFQTILGRMGIALDFGENTNAREQYNFGHHSPSLSISSRGSLASAGKYNEYADNTDSIRHALPINLKNPRSPSSAVNVALSDGDTDSDQDQHLAQDFPPHHAPTSRERHATHKSAREFSTGYEEPQSPAHALSLLPDHASFLNERISIPSSKQALPLERDLGKSMIDEDALESNQHAPATQNTNLDAKHTPQPYGGVEQLELDAYQPLAVVSPVSENPDSYSMGDTMLISRAIRAREIYLASRVFNHWADRTATRLEREAVARRHMIRFRCFQGWSKSPTSTIPTAGYLKTLTGARKLQRAVAANETQLRQSAIELMEFQHGRIARRVLNQWRCRIRELSIRNTTVSALKTNVISWWFTATSQNTTMSQTTSRVRSDFNAIRALVNWQKYASLQAEVHHSFQNAGRQCRLLRQLRDWRNCSELSRRAQDFRISRLTSRISLVFDTWSVRATEQAIIWAQAYSVAMRALRRWQITTKNNEQSTAVSELLRNRNYSRQLLSLIHDAENDSLRLTRSADRARLYIRGTGILHVLENSLKKQVHLKKEQLRRQLMQTYREVSGKRKRRQFQSALTRWQTFTYQQETQLHSAFDHSSSHIHDTSLTVLQRWFAASANTHWSQITHDEYQMNKLLNRWVNYITLLDHTTLTGRNIRQLKQQREHVRGWNKSSLQGSGQQHTANMVRQQHSSDKRSRALQMWKSKIKSTSEQNRSQRLGQIVPTSEPPRASNRMWKSRYDKLRRGSQEPSFQRTPFGSLETPTKWTGQPLPMASSVSIHRMPTLRETDTTFGNRYDRQHNLETSSSLPILSNAKFSSKQSTSKTPRNWLSTTPKVPIPIFLQPDSPRPTAQMRDAVVTSLPPTISTQRLRSLVNPYDDNQNEADSKLSTSLQTSYQ